MCDLTGRERTIEVQYHCNPGASGDRISWIKEVTTCTYLMEVRTPRLCEDMAFLPPKPTRAHPISCQLIVGSDEEAARFRKQKTLDAARDGTRPGVDVAAKHADGSSNKQGAGSPNPAQQQQQQSDFRGMTIGGVVVGGRQVLGAAAEGQPAPTLAPPRGFVSKQQAQQFPASQLIEMLAAAKTKADGTKIEQITDEELEKLNLSPETIEELRQEMQKIAGEKGCRSRWCSWPAARRSARHRRRRRGRRPAAAQWPREGQARQGGRRRRG